MAAKRRPSFSPEPTKTRDTLAPTDWVYRSDQPAATPPPKATAGGRASKVARAATPAPRARMPRKHGTAGRTAALLTPLALVHVIVVAPLAGCVRRWLKAV